MTGDTGCTSPMHTMTTSHPCPQSQSQSKYPWPTLTHWQKPDLMQQGGGGQPAGSSPRPPDTTKQSSPPTPTYNCNAPFCHASLLQRLSTYKARPICTIPTNRRELIPYLTNNMGWQTSPREVGWWGGARHWCSHQRESAGSQETQGERGKAHAHHR